MNKKGIWIVIAIVAVIVIILVSNHRSNFSEAIKIGQMSALTNIGSDIGEEERNGTLLAIEKVNAGGGVDGRQIQMISEDTPAFDVKAGAAAANKLIAVDGVVAIVGPQWDSEGEVLASISADKKVPVISQNVSTDIESKINSDYFFVTWPDDEVGIRAILQFAKDKGWKKIAIIEPANFSFWSYTANLMQKNASEFGISIVSKEMGTDISNVDYRTLLSKAKLQKPDALFGSFADIQCVFLKQSKEQGLNLPFLSTDSAGNPKPLAECPDLLNGRLYFSTPSQGHGYTEFVQAYEKRFGAKPQTSSAVSAYNAGLVLAEALKNLDKAGKEITRENVKTELSQIQFTGGVSMETIQFNDKGYVVTQPQSYEMRTVKEGKFVKAE